MTNPLFWLAKLVKALGGAWEGNDTHCWTGGAWGTFVAFQSWSTLEGRRGENGVIWGAACCAAGASFPLEGRRLTMGPGRPRSPGKPRKPGGPSFPGRPAGPGSPCNNKDKELRSCRCHGGTAPLSALEPRQTLVKHHFLTGSSLWERGSGPGMQGGEASRLLIPTLVPSFPVRPGRPCSPGGPGGPGCPRSPMGPVSPVGP